jgi:hypothetical protein
MADLGDAVKEALAAEAEAGQGVEAARSEQQRGKSALSADLLLEAIQKEKDSLQLWEEGVETLRQALEDRRRALDQQEELLTELAEKYVNKQVP